MPHTPANHAVLRFATLACLGALALCPLPAAAQVASQPPAPANAPVVRDAAIDHVTFSVANIDRMAEWYEKVFGFKVAVRDNSTPGTIYRQLRTPTLRLDLVQYRGSARPPAAHSVFLHQGIAHLALSVPDLPAALAALNALHTDANLADPGSKTPHIVVHDPEGNEIEIFARP